MQRIEVVGGRTLRIKDYLTTNFLMGSGVALSFLSVSSAVDRINHISHQIDLRLILILGSHPHYIVDKFVNDITLLGLGLALYAVGFSNVLANVSAGRYRLRSDMQVNENKIV